MEAKDFRIQPITDKIFNRAELNEAFEKGKQVGIKEVVEWMETHKTLNFIDPFGHTPRLERWVSSVNSDDWQAKLKEWGVKDGS